ncbi:hypothetical protein HPP92_017873 [Vanilla planifolia]|uniref:Uncharacterized protein n=1 Tax=Vanilla planifolia TaxID=51239 RepID=A0A835QCD9_VANPL|nr:hypothetical protein HPP92_017873 [Vanilla planifolia]
MAMITLFDMFDSGCLALDIRGNGEVLTCDQVDLNDEHNMDVKDSYYPLLMIRLPLLIMEKKKTEALIAPGVLACCASVSIRLGVAGAKTPLLLNETLETWKSWETSRSTTWSAPPLRCSSASKASAMA